LNLNALRLVSLADNSRTPQNAPTNTQYQFFSQVMMVPFKIIYDILRLGLFRMDIANLELVNFN